MNTQFDARHCIGIAALRTVCTLWLLGLQQVVGAVLVHGGVSCAVTAHLTVSLAVY